MSKAQSRRLMQMYVAMLPLFVTLSALAYPLQATQVGTVIGIVTREDGVPLGGVLVRVEKTGKRTRTVTDGQYRLSGLSVGPHTLEFQTLGYATQRAEVRVAEGGTVTVNVVLVLQPVDLGSVVVRGVSLMPERVIDAPAAVDVVNPSMLRAGSITGQVPLAFATLPSWDVVQSGVNDFNVNSRGFNSTLARSVTVLMDGRDVGVPFLGSQEWAALGLPTEDFARMELIRGPSSALYGANAFNGVLRLRTPAARDVVGTKLSLSGGGLGSLRGDIRHAGITSGGRFGYRLNLGYSRSSSWSRSRTRFDGADFVDEYAPATSSAVVPPPPGFELVPLNGQNKDGTTGEALGSADDLSSVSAVGRFDYYADGGSVFTVDGGVAQVQNGLFVTAIGRVQVVKATRPWARVAWATDAFDLSASYSGRIANDPQVLLSSAAPIDDQSGTFQADGQYHSDFADDRGRAVLGASFREGRVNTKGTLMDLSTDDRTDRYYSGFGQIDFSVLPQLRLVGAARWDDSNLFTAQFSPKGAVVFSPNENHAVRLTVSRAFLTPSQIEFFLRIQPNVQDLSLLEAGLRASPLGPALGGVPNGALFEVSSAVPIVAHGNAALTPERVTSYELGYKGQIRERLFVTVDGFIARRANFVTALSPATLVNSAFQSWSAPSSVPAPARGPLEEAVGQSLAGTTAEFGLTRLPDGTTAIVLSYGNAGKVNEWGFELGANLAITDHLELAGGYAFYDFDFKDPALSATHSPNTPKHKATALLSYSGPQGLDIGASARIKTAYRWASGIFDGQIPASQTVNVHAGYWLRPNIRVHGIATNIFDQQRFHAYGGSVNGRRVLGGLTAVF